MSPVGAARTAASSFYVDCRDESAPLDAWDHTQKVCLDKRWLYDWQVPQTPGASSFATLCSDPVYVHNTQTGEWDQCCQRTRVVRPGGGIFGKMKALLVEKKVKYWACKPMEELRHQYFWDTTPGSDGVGRHHYECGSTEDCSAPSKVCLTSRQPTGNAGRLMKLFGLADDAVCLDVGESGVHGSVSGLFGKKDREVWYFADPWPLAPPAPGAPPAGRDGAAPRRPRRRSGAPAAPRRGAAAARFL